MTGETITSGELDRWISDLMECKTLSEADVKRLCDKVETKFFLFFMFEQQSHYFARNLFLNFIFDRAF
jgi:hypothetical protein